MYIVLYSSTDTLGEWLIPRKFFSSAPSIISYYLSPGQTLLLLFLELYYLILSWGLHSDVTASPSPSTTNHKLPWSHEYLTYPTVFVSLTFLHPLTYCVIFLNFQRSMEPRSLEIVFPKFDPLKVVTNEKGEALGEVLTIRRFGEVVLDVFLSL